MPFLKFSFFERFKKELNRVKEKQNQDFDLFSSLSSKEKLRVLISISLLYYVLNVAIWFISKQTFSPDTHTVLAFFVIFLSTVSISEISVHIFQAAEKKYSWFILSLVSIGTLFGGFFGYRYGKDIGFAIGTFFNQEVGFTELLLSIDLNLVVKFLILISAVVGTFAGINLLIKSVRTIHTQKTQREHEIELAQNIQEQLIPEKSISTSDIHIHGQSLMAGEVGGDYFEIVPLSESRYILAVGDVAGHNIAAGLIMAMVKSSLLTALHQTQKPNEILEMINSILVNHSTKKHYVTFQLILVDRNKKELTLANAGHLPLFELDRKSGTVATYKPKGIGLGISHLAKFETQTVTLKPHSTYLMLTDGLVEKRTQDGQMNGLLDFLPWLESLHPPDDTAVRKHLSDSFNEQRESEKDDATFVVFSMPT